VTLSNSQAAQLGLMVAYAMDQFQADRGNLAPKPDPRLSPNWKVLGYLTGTDCIFRIGRTPLLGAEVCYGYLAQDVNAPNVYVAAIRGTEGILEWIEDGEFAAVTHPVAGKVEAGFFGVYSSLKYRPLSGGVVPAAAGISAAVGPPGELIVLGHSLGSAVATYLTFDLAAPTLLGTRVQGCFFASPRPGNDAFVQAFDARVPEYQLWNYQLDVVPRVPLGPDYSDLSKVTWIEMDDTQAKICFDLACHHHILCYAAMLDYGLLDWKNVPASDRANAACIKGPSL
jgi:triacylglycerol lipase